MGIFFWHYARTNTWFVHLPIFCQNIVACGEMSVGFFYLLSGFVLAHAYSRRMPATPAARRSFWFARFARLYPVYLLAFLLFLPQAAEKYLLHPAPGLAGGRTFLLAGLLNLTALQSWTSLALAWNGPSWSLSVEAFFYLIFPLIAATLLRTARTRLLVPLTLSWLAMISLPLSHQAGWMSDNLWDTWIRKNPLFWTPLFLAGIAVYRLHPRIARLSGQVTALLGSAVVLLLLVLAGALPLDAQQILIFGGAAPLFALVVVLHAHPTSLTARLLGTRLLFEAGAISYILYILQAPIVHYVDFAIVKLGFTAPQEPLWRFPLCLAAVLATAFAAQILVERPARVWLLARHSNRNQPPNLDPGIEAV